ncbi:MAG: hypothetical protein ABIE74_06635 [Pseudomonadota bacterium]
MTEEKSFKNLHSKWLDWLEKDEHAICKQLYQMSWDYALFLVVGELGKIASQHPKPNIGFNEPILNLLVSGFVTTQAFFIRRLVDKRKDVISLCRLIDDMKENIDVITRENYVCINGLSYDFDEPRKEQKRGFTILDAKDAWPESKIRHEEFDKLSGVDENKRNKCDKIKESFFDDLNKKLETCKDIQKYSNKYMAHAADEESRNKLSEDEKRVTLNKIDECHKAIFQVFSALLWVLKNESMISPIPCPQYDHLKNLDKAWADDEMMAKARDIWNKRMKEVQNWKNTSL